jgi:hypothetical protein
MEEVMGKLAVVREFRRRFEAEMGHIGCRELTGVDLSTEEGLKQSMESGIFERVCSPAVAASYRLVVALLQESEQTGVIENL